MAKAHLTARARKILPLVEQWCDAFYPEDVTADIVIDFRGDPKKDAKLNEIRQQMRKRTLQDKLINPEFAFLMRADFGFLYLLRQIGAKVNVSEICRRVAAARFEAEIPEIEGRKPKNYMYNKHPYCMDG